MCQRVLLVTCVLGALLVCAAPGAARLLENWPYDKLMEKADLVIFANAVKTEDTDDASPKHDWPYEFAGQNTTFKIKHAVKGKVDGKEIKVLHFKWGKLKKGRDTGNAMDVIIENGPMLVAFDPRKAPDHLLFLKALKDGRYEPVSGRIDPQLSVRLLRSPRESLEGKDE